MNFFWSSGQYTSTVSKPKRRMARSRMCFTFARKWALCSRDQDVRPGIRVSRRGLMMDSGREMMATFTKPRTLRTISRLASAR